MNEKFKADFELFCRLLDESLKSGKLAARSADAQRSTVKKWLVELERLNISDYDTGLEQVEPVNYWAVKKFLSLIKAKNLVGRKVSLSIDGSKVSGRVDGLSIAGGEILLKVHLDGGRELLIPYKLLQRLGV